VGERGAVQSAIKAQDATLAPRTEVQAHAVADLDRRQIDSIIKEAAKRGRTEAPSTIDGQRRQVLADERQQEAPTLEAEHATLGAKGQQIEADATPIRHVTEPIGADTDREWAIRWLLALMVLSCDQPAKAVAAAASARNGP
jgi:hypothetical protein